MSGLCDRCNERSSHIVNIAHLPELISVAHLGYRQVCSPCYDDLLTEADDAEERVDDRRVEPRYKVSIKARVEGNTAHFEPFSDEMTVEEISPTGLRLHTARELEPGSVLKLVVPSHEFEATVLVDVVWSEAGQRSVGLKLTEPSETWKALCEQHVPEE
jgi:PilZ domain-containing protein